MQAAATRPAHAGYLAPTTAIPPQLTRFYVVIKMADGSRGEHTGLYAHAWDAWERAMELFPEAALISVVASRGAEHPAVAQAPARPARGCLELGLCQNRKPLCDDCLERPLRLALGVVDGPYHRASRVGLAARAAARKAGAGIGMVVAWLMGPHP